MPRVLLVEDNLPYAEDLAEYLSEVGHIVWAAQTARAMWVILSTATPDVVLLDLGLPDADGLELIPLLRERFPLLAILVLSAQTNANVQAQALALGADGYLTKPAKFVSLALHLDRVAAADAVD